VSFLPATEIGRPGLRGAKDGEGRFGAETVDTDW